MTSGNNSRYLVTIDKTVWDECGGNMVYDMEGRS